MSLTRLAVHRPVTTIMASLITVLLGVISLRGLSVDLMPEITLPTISIETLYRGAGPEEIELLITEPLEQALSSVHGVERLSSESMEGSSTIRVQMQWGVDLDTTIADMRQAIETTRRYSDLPEGIEEPTIRRYDVADSPIMYLGLGGTLKGMELTRLTETEIVPALARVHGVARVGLRGEVRREIQVNLDRDKLEALNLRVSEVTEALRRENVNQPAGDYDEGNVQRIIRSEGEFTDLRQIADTIVRDSGRGVVRIRDIGTVVDGIEERTESTRVNGDEAVMLYVFKQAGANTVEVSDRVHAEIARINARSKGVQLAVRQDKADFIRQSIANVQTSALYGMGLAVVVLVIFLRSFRSTLIIGISMPLAMLATFVLMYFQGFTLNMISFGGLALGIGMLVDNSIVVLESIFCQRDAGLTPEEAAVVGTQEVSSAIVASTLTTMIVFLPLVFVTGITGVMLNQLAWVVSFSLLCSLFASLTLTPMLAAKWMTAKPEDGGAPDSPGKVHAMHAATKRVLDAMEAGYGRMLSLSFRFRNQVALLLFVVLAVTVGLVPRIGTEFLPPTDEGELSITGEMAAGIQLDELTRQSVKIEDTVLERVPELDSLAVFIGDDAADGEDWNRSRFRAVLASQDERTRSTDEVVKDLSEHIGSIAGMKVRVEASKEMMVFRMLSRYGGGGSDIEVEVRGHDRETGEELAQAVAAAMAEIPGLTNIEVGTEDRRPELSTTIDRAKASRLGISVSDITQTLETAVLGTTATTFRESGEEANVVVRLREQDRSRLHDVEHVGVATRTARVIPLKNLVHFEYGESPIQIGRLDQQRMIPVVAGIEDRDLGSVVADLQARLDRLALPAGFTLNIAGDWEEQQKSFAALFQGLILAILLMYMVMAAQFESLRDPLFILVTIPLGAIGVIWALLMTDTTFNTQSFIGVVMLAGIVVNNAIVLIDYINQLWTAEPDASLEDVIRRGCIRRLRPILMTTLTTVLGMLPIALGLGEGGELQAPMARVVIGGLISGTVITLIAIPLIFHAFGPRRELRRVG